MTIFLIFFLLFIPFTEAWAYLDPGAGSMLIQIIAVGAAGFLTILKLYWKRITWMVKKLIRK